MSDSIKRYDDAIDRAAIAAIAIRRYTSKAQGKAETSITIRHAFDAEELAKRLEAVVNDFGLEL